MNQSVAILGFEPALQSALRSLLGREPGLELADDAAESPDILLISPGSVEWAVQLRARYPRARIVAMVEWHRRSSYSEASIDQFVDGLAGYENLLQQILGKN